MKEQKELYEALEKAERMLAPSGIGDLMDDVDSNIDVIKATAEEGLRNSQFMETALIIIAEYAGLAGEHMDDVNVVCRGIKRVVNEGLMEPEAVEGEEWTP